LSEFPFFQNFITLVFRSFDQEDDLCNIVAKNAMERFQQGPTVIQQYVIPCILYTKRDLVVRAHTGSGKSAAFLLPLIHVIHEEKMKEQQRKTNKDAPYAVVFLPTRELALQVAKEATCLAKGNLLEQDYKCLFPGTKVKIGFCLGGTDMRDNYDLLKNGTDILIGTVGRTYHLFFGIEKDQRNRACLDFHKLKYCK
jgi:superfamily II DNA/RNA helicase